MYLHISAEVFWQLFFDVDFIFQGQLREGTIYQHLVGFSEVEVIAVETQILATMFVPLHLHRGKGAWKFVEQSVNRLSQTVGL